MSEFKWGLFDGKMFEALISELMRTENRLDPLKRHTAVRPYGCRAQTKYGIDLVEDSTEAGDIPLAVQCTITGRDITEKMLTTLINKLKEDVGAFYSKDSFPEFPRHFPKYNETHRFVLATLASRTHDKFLNPVITELHKKYKSANRPAIWYREDLEARICAQKEMKGLHQRLIKHALRFTEKESWKVYRNALCDTYYVNDNKRISLEIIEDHIILRWRADGKSDLHQPEINGQPRPKYSRSQPVKRRNNLCQKDHYIKQAAPPYWDVSKLLQIALSLMPIAPTEYFTVTLKLNTGSVCGIMATSENNTVASWHMTPKNGSKVPQIEDAIKMNFEMCKPKLWPNPVRFFANIKLINLISQLKQLDKGVTPDIERAISAIAELELNRDIRYSVFELRAIDTSLISFMFYAYSYAERCMDAAGISFSYHDFKTHEQTKDITNEHYRVKCFFTSLQEDSILTKKYRDAHFYAYQTQDNAEYLREMQNIMISHLTACLNVLKMEYGITDIDLIQR